VRGDERNSVLLKKVHRRDAVSAEMQHTEDADVAFVNSQQTDDVADAGSWHGRLARV